MMINFIFSLFPFFIVTLSANLVSTNVIAVNKTGSADAIATGNPIEIGHQGLPNPSAILGAENANTNETIEFDFVNLPGYGVIDDANSTTNGSFSCYERRYGYYADISRACQMFHLCYPVKEPQTNQIIYQRFSFVCSENAVFDQAHLVCVDNDTAPIACEESLQYYEVSNDRLLDSLQATQPGLFAMDEEIVPSSNETSAIVEATQAGTTANAATSSSVETVSLHSL